MTKLKAYFKMFLQFPENGKRFALNFAINLSFDKKSLLHFFSATWHFSYFITSLVDKSNSGLQIFLSSYAHVSE
jgi:hypothetical protein